MCVFPLFSFFIKLPAFHNRACSVLLEFIDTVDGVSEDACQSDLPNTIIELKAPSATALLILAKLCATKSASFFTSGTPLTFTMVKQHEVIRVGMLVMTLVIAVQGASVAPTFAMHTPLCIEHAEDCAPYSAILLASLLADKRSSNMAFGAKFLALAGDDLRPINRAAFACLVGAVNDGAHLPTVVALLQDKSPLVRAQAVYAVARFGRTEALPQSDADPLVTRALRDVAVRPGAQEGVRQLQRIVVEAVRGAGFEQHYRATGC